MNRLAKESRIRADSKTGKAGTLVLWRTQQSLLPIEELARAAGLHIGLVEQLVEYGVVEPAPGSASPILFPIARSLGIDPVHFGVVMAVNMEVGLCHPPVGLNLYVASGISGLRITELTVAVWPWLLAMILFLVAVTYVPVISLWLPSLLGTGPTCAGDSSFWAE